MIPRSVESWEEQPLYWVKAGKPNGNWVLVPMTGEEFKQSVLNERLICAVWKKMDIDEFKLMKGRLRDGK